MEGQTTQPRLGSPLGKDPGVGASKDLVANVILYTGVLTEVNMGENMDRATLRLRGGASRS